MPRVAPKNSRRRSRSVLHRPPPAALLPLAIGFVGALALDRASARDDEPAPRSLVVIAGEPTLGAMGAQEVAPAEPAAEVSGAVRGDAQRRAPVRVEPVVVASAAGASSREPALEAKLDKVLVDGKTPYAATVLLEAQTGRVIAIAEHSTRGPSEGLAFKPIAPAASVFKIVTSSALLRAGVSTGAKVCTHGGRTRMQPSLLVDNPKRDHTCHTFGDALPESLNVAIAKLALKHLDPDTLRAEAARWGFDAPLPVDRAPAGLLASTTSIPDDPFGFANAAAGFGDVKISALHGAVLASIVANQGMLVPPELVEDQDAPAPRRVIPADVAKKLQKMMVDTVESGTGRKAFSQAPRLGVSAGGKTGSLADYSTGLDTSWFVGFAPAERPEVIVASVVVNTSKWHIKAPYVAKEALRAYFQAHPSTKKSAVVAAR